MGSRTKRISNKIILFAILINPALSTRFAAALEASAACDVCGRTEAKPTTLVNQLVEVLKDAFHRVRSETPTLLDSYFLFDVTKNDIGFTAQGQRPKADDMLVASHIFDKATQEKKRPSDVLKAYSTQMSPSSKKLLIAMLGEWVTNKEKDQKSTPKVLEKYAEALGLEDVEIKKGLLIYSDPETPKTLPKSIIVQKGPLLFSYEGSAKGDGKERERIQANAVDATARFLSREKHGDLYSPKIATWVQGEVKGGYALELREPTKYQAFLKPGEYTSAVTDPSGTMAKSFKSGDTTVAFSSMQGGHKVGDDFVKIGGTQQEEKVLNETQKTAESNTAYLNPKASYHPQEIHEIPWGPKITVIAGEAKQTFTIPANQSVSLQGVDIEKVEKAENGEVKVYVKSLKTSDAQNTLDTSEAFRPIPSAALPPAAIIVSGPQSKPIPLSTGVHFNLDDGKNIDAGCQIGSELLTAIGNPNREARSACSVGLRIPLN